MCSARARRCRALCDVLFMPQLVTILPHILLSHFCVCSSCPCVCSSSSVYSSSTSSSSSSSSFPSSSSSSSSFPFSSPSSCCCCCCCYPCSFFLILIVAENRQIGGVFAVFSDSESKQHRKYRCCLRLRTPKPRYLYTCFFFLLVARIAVFTVFWVVSVKNHVSPICRWRCFPHVTC